MPHSNIIKADTEEQIIAAIVEQLNTKEEKRNYTAQFDMGEHCITLDIDSHTSAKGDDEGITTLLTAQLPEEYTFRFLLILQNLKNQIKKLFGMQDILVGHEALDRKFIIQANDENKIKPILTDEKAIDMLLKYPVISFEIRELKFGAHDQVVLTLDVDGRLTEQEALLEVHQLFKMVMDRLTQP